MLFALFTLADKTLCVPVLAESLNCLVCYRVSAGAALWEHGVLVAVLTIGPCVLFPVGHVVREHHEAAVTLEMLRVPALVHGLDTGPYDVIIALVAF